MKRLGIVIVATVAVLGIFALWTSLVFPIVWLGLHMNPLFMLPFALVTFMVSVIVTYRASEWVSDRWITSNR